MSGWQQSRASTIRQPDVGMVRALSFHCNRPVLAIALAVLRHVRHNVTLAALGQSVV